MTVDRVTPGVSAAAVAALSIARHDGEVILGRPDLGIYVEIPEPGAVLVEALQSGLSLANSTARASDAAGEIVDGQDFLGALARAGLLEEPGAAGAAAPGDRGRTIRWIEGVSPETARRLFGRTAWLCYLGAAVFSVTVLILRPELRPNFEAAWFLPDPVLSVLAAAPLFLIVGAVHEAWHWLAGRAIGVPAVFRLSRRGIYLVFETDLTQIVAKPRRQRYAAFLAGMAIEGCLLAVALGTRLLYHANLIDLPGFVNRLLALFVLSTVISLVWQWAAVFMRSDGYAVLANALGCHSLHRVTWLTVKDRLFRVNGAERAELDEAHPRDLRVARWFGLLYIVGMVTVAWTFVNLTLPILVGLWTWIANNIVAADIGSVAFWESIIAAIYLTAAYGSPLLIARRERRLRRSGHLL